MTRMQRVIYIHIYIYTRVYGEMGNGSSRLAERQRGFLYIITEM